MEKLLKFISENSDKDVARLILDRKKHPEIDMDLAINCIESRRKLKGKVQEWYDNPELIFPLKLSAEQCSSSATGTYKADMAAKIAMGSFDFAQDDIKMAQDDKGWRIADLTGGLGVDSWFFSQKAEKVLYNDMQAALYDAAGHNFKALGRENIERSCLLISSDTISDALKGFNPDIVYMDPARRGEGGKKVFLIEDCTPDVLTIKDEIFKYTRHILLKLSPMADITMACSRLGKTCREVHVVATGGECKELLIWMDKEWNSEYSITAVELHPNADTATFTYIPSEESNATSEIWRPKTCNINDSSLFLFEPGKALMKAGAYNLIGSTFKVEKLGKSTHYYITESIQTAEKLKTFGKVYCIMDYHPLDKRTIKEIGKKYPKSEVTARNIPMDTDALRQKLGVTSGDDAHIFGLKSDLEGNILMAGRRLF